MTKRFALPLARTLMTSLSLPPAANKLPDVKSVPPDLNTPSIKDARPAPGERVKMVAPSYQGTYVYHALYLPTDWKKGKKYPVIVEYAGNGPYRNEYGDTCSGKIEDCNLGYGISGGQGFIWVCLPCIGKGHKHNQLQWWGDLKATVEYCKTVVPSICKAYGGDPKAVFLAGFSRGSIACNFIGLHDDDIATLWRGLICHSHYDGVSNWPDAGSDSASVTTRLKRLKDKPQFISHEGSVDETQQYLEKTFPKGDFTFQAIPYRNHTDSWVLRNIPQRKALRQWLTGILAKENQQDGQRLNAGD